MNLDRIVLRLAAAIPVAAGAIAFGGSYSTALNDPSNAYDAPVPGFTGAQGIGKARIDDGFVIQHPDNHVNPLFFAWADSWQDYERSDADASYNDPAWALGPVTGDNFDVVSLGDMNAMNIANGDPPGRITLTFAKPIRNRSGADFVIFENGIIYNLATGALFAELAHVEVSADGVTFHRFPSTSLTVSPVGGYSALDPTNVHNLAGKHANSYGECWGTPFDIGQLGLEQVTHVRLIDIPGNGSFSDDTGNPIYDPWLTFGSGGFDLEAVGAVSIDMTYDEWPPLQQLPVDQRGENDDPDHDGIPNLLEYAFGLVPWAADPPSAGWSHSLVAEAGSAFIEVTTLRDERLIDLTREIRVSNDMSSWQTIAISTAGAPFVAAGGHAVAITEENAGNIASVGVIRRDRIRDLSPVIASGPRFYQLKASRATP